MRLIDADSFFKDIVKRCGCIPYVEGRHGEAIYLSNLIGEQPTAYDVEKVVEKIADYYDLVPGWALKEIIEIIKSSGIR